MNTPERRSFAARLGQMYGFYTLALAAFVMMMALLGHIGVPRPVIATISILAITSTFVVIGLTNRTMRYDEYHTAGGAVPELYLGMTGGADWLAAACFLGLVGWIYTLGFDGLAPVVGGIGGYVVMTVVILPYLRRFGADTVPEFLGARFGVSARYLSTAILLVCALVLLTAQIQGAATIVTWITHLGLSYAIYGCVAVLLVCTVLGGARSATWTQVAQYVVLAGAFLLPAFWLATSMVGIPLPYLVYGDALAGITALESAQSIAPSFVDPFDHGGLGALDFLFLTVSVIAGVAAMPHLLARPLMAASVQSARSTTAWTLFFVALLLITAPASAAFARWLVLEFIGSGIAPDQLAERAGWALRWAAVDPGLVSICGAAVTDAATALAACAQRGTTQLAMSDLALRPDMVFLALPEVAGMPSFMSGLVAAGGLAATFGAATAILISTSNTLTSELFHAIGRKQPPAALRMFISRLLLVALTLIAAFIATHSRPMDFMATMLWAASLSAAGLFPALALGIWARPVNTPAALAGMASGFLLTLYYGLATYYDPVGFVGVWRWLSSASAEQLAQFDVLKAAASTGNGEALAALEAFARPLANWWGIQSYAAAALGMPLGLAVMITVSRLGMMPPQHMRQVVDSIHDPRGVTPVEVRS